MTVTFTRPTIDINGFYPLELLHDNSGNLLRLDLSRAKEPYFLQHMQQLTQVVVDGTAYAPTVQARHTLIYPNMVEFALPALHDGQHVQVMVNGQPVTDFTMAQGALLPTPNHVLNQLAVSETRALGMGLSESGGALKLIPYDRKKRTGFDPKKHAPITDVHTHSTAQITAEGMIRAAEAIDREAGDKADKGMSYPVELLEKLGVPAQPDQPQHTVPSFYFSPTAKQGLTCEQQDGTCQAVRITDLTPQQKQAITAKIQVMGDETMPFGDFDPQMYRFRNPLAKHPGMARRMLMEIAEDYARNGIEYAELSTSSMMLNTNWLREMIATVNDIERDGVNVTLDDGTVENRKPHLRFLVAIQRNLPAQTTLEYIEKIKYLARHPYIAGVDLVGYESNKTRDFHWALSHLAQWASVSQGTELKPEDGWDMKRDFIMRVHAGETGKNPENVRDAIAFAKDYGVRVRVAHALNVKLDKNDERDIRELADKKNDAGMFAPLKAMLGDLAGAVKDNLLQAVDTLSGASKDLIGIELCPDSNQVFLTKPLVHTAPFQARRDLNAMMFLGSDGGGAIATNPVQLAYSAIAAGASLKDLEAMQKEERGYIDRQMARETIKQHAYATLYGKEADAAFVTGYEEKIAKLHKAGGNPGDKGKPSNTPLAEHKDDVRDIDAQIKALQAQRATLMKPLDQEGLPKSMLEKTPVLIGGASGDTWKSMRPEEQDKIKESISLLIKTLDPKKTYFVLGRTKNDGVSKVLDDLVKKYNLEHPTNQFQVLARYSGAGNEPTSELPESVSWVHNIPGELSKVSKSMVDFLDARGGRALFFGGSTFTTEMIEYCHKMGVPFQMFVPSEGMIKEKASTVPDTFQISLSKIPLKEYVKRVTDKLYVTHDHTIDYMDPAERAASRSKFEPQLVSVAGTGILADLVSEEKARHFDGRFAQLNPDDAMIDDLVREVAEARKVGPEKDGRDAGSRKR